MRAEDLGRPIKILLVEDKLDDAEFTQLTLQEVKVINRLHHVTHGEAAMTFLRDPNNPRPDIVLLDLNMPRMNGQEVLQAVKSDESLKSIPIIILTTSGLETDVHHAYQNYANTYLRKPVELGDFAKVVTKFRDFWVQVVELPSYP